MVVIYEGANRIWPVNSGILPYRGVGSRVSRFARTAVGRPIGRAANAYMLAKGMVRSVLGKRGTHQMDNITDMLRGKKSWKQMKADSDDYAAYLDKNPPWYTKGFNAIGNWEKRQLQSIGNSLSSVGRSITGGRNPKLIQFDPNGPKGPGIVLPPSTKRSQSNMSKRSYNTFGNGGGKFSGKKRRKIATAAYRGVQLSREHQELFSDAAACYVGHNSHPMEDTLRSIGLAIARLVAKKWGQDFNNFESFINGDTSAADDSTKVTITYRDSLGGVLQSHNFVLTNKSWYQFGDQLMHQIIQLIELESPSPTYWHGEQIIVANSSGTTGNAHNLIKMDFSELKIKINGFSCMKVQNRTVSTSGDAETNEQHSDIANNPLTGKMYEGHGQVHDYKFNNDYGTTTDIFRYNVTGYLEIGAINATLTDPMQKVLKRPPSYKFLKGLTSQTSIRLNPGEIKTSVVRATYTYTLNGWIRKLLNVIRASEHLGAVTPAMCHIGKSHILGLSHMLFDASDPSISLAVQVDSTVSAIATHKKKAIAAPVFDRAIETVALIA